MQRKGVDTSARAERASPHEPADSDWFVCCAPGVSSQTAGIDVVLAAMHAHIGVAKMLASGCRALCCLTYLNDENRAKIVAAGGINTVLAAMRAHVHKEAVQGSGSGLTLFLLQVSSYLARIF